MLKCLNSGRINVVRVQPLCILIANSCDTFHYSWSGMSLHFTFACMHSGQFQTCSVLKITLVVQKKKKNILHMLLRKIIPDNSCNS